MKTGLVDNNPQVSTAAESTSAAQRVTLSHRLQYWAVKMVLEFLGWLPHRLARAVCAVLAALGYWLWPRLRRVGLFNLQLAFPDSSDAQRRKTIFNLFQNFGRMLADFAHFPHWNRAKYREPDHLRRV